MHIPTMTHTPDQKTLWHGRTKAQVPMRYSPIKPITSGTAGCRRYGVPHPMPQFDAMIRARKVRDAVKQEAKKKREAA